MFSVCCNYLFDAHDHSSFNHSPAFFNQQHSVFNQFRFSFNERFTKRDTYYMTSLQQNKLFCCRAKHTLHC